SSVSRLTAMCTGTTAAPLGPNVPSIRTVLDADRVGDHAPGLFVRNYLVNHERHDTEPRVALPKGLTARSKDAHHFVAVDQNELPLVLFEQARALLLVRLPLPLKHLRHSSFSFRLRAPCARMMQRKGRHVSPQRPCASIPVSLASPSTRSRD